MLNRWIHASRIDLFPINYLEGVESTDSMKASNAALHTEAIRGPECALLTFIIAQVKR